MTFGLGSAGQDYYQCTPGPQENLSEQPQPVTSLYVSTSCPREMSDAKKKQQQQQTKKKHMDLATCVLIYFTGGSGNFTVSLST